METQKFIELFASVEADYEKALVIYSAKIEKALAECNNGLIPKVDRLGRFHAAVDGYCDLEDKIYLKGQFIPMPESDEDHLNLIEWFAKNFGKAPSGRVKIQGDLIDAVKNLPYKDGDHWINSVICLSLGKQWDQDGIKTCYAYVSSITKHTLKQSIEILKSLAEQSAPPKKDKGIAPQGKQVITGKVIGLPIHDGYYGITYKMMVELENGATIYGSLPKAIFEAEIGDRVEFSANFDQAKDDQTHAFYKRPSKAKIL